MPQTAAIVPAKAVSPDKGSTIDLYLGDFLISPVPLEMSLNWCSHACHVCFANLGNPERKANAPAIMAQLARVDKGKGLDSLLMRSGYPVLISNRVDPFANSNYKQALPIMETMTEQGIPFTIQTRGGRGIDDVLSFAPPSVWYVTICTLDDALRKELEPGAPTTESRFDLIRQLKEAGHRVVLGLNPAVPEWCPEPAALLERAKAAGAEGVWTDPLHLSKRLADRISDKGKAAVTLPLIQRSQLRRLAPEDERCAQAVIDAATALGMPSYSVGQWKPSAFFEPFTETYGAECLFPTTQDFLNACWEHLDHGDVLTFDDFAEFFCPWLPEGKWPISRYIAAKFHDFLNENRVPSSMTYRELLAIVWSEPRFSQCLARLPCFAYAGQRTADGKGWVKFVDERGLPFLVFNRDEKGFDDYFAPAEVVPDIHGIAGESEVNILIPIDA
jgi:DNA repair photolyase